MKKAEVYPFDFSLKIGYQLEKDTVRVLWKVENTGTKVMPFAIGAHPAFLCPPAGGKPQTSCFITLYDPEGVPVESVESHEIGEGGLAVDGFVKYAAPKGVLPITEDLFDHDALVLENRQVSQVGLMDENGCEFGRVKFEAPLVGIWSPAGKNAPFVCIEPWYGRCDAAGFCGELDARVWENLLGAGETFSVSYDIRLPREA